MKRALTVVLFLLFTIGVCVDGYEVSVTERDSVTLKSGVTEIQTDDEIEWKFNGKSKIATISRSDSGISVWVEPDGSFRDRLQLDNQTGDLKISNISTTDSGEYKVKISSTRGSPEMIFTVQVFAAAAKPVSVLVGATAPLYTDLTDIQRDDEIQWRFGPQKSPVAQINRKAGIFNTSDGPDGRFRDRLKLDHQTGSLNITNTRITDSGDYELKIIRTSNRYTRHYTQSFTVTVSDYVEKVSVLKGNNVTLQTRLPGTQRIEQIEWKFGDDDEVIADLSSSNKKWTNTDLILKSGDLIIRNIQTDQNGDYKVEIKTRTMILHRKYQITVDAVPESGWSSGAVAGIGVGVGVVGVLLGAAAGVIYYRHKRSKEDIHKKKDASQIPLGNVDPGTKEKGYDSS